MGRSPSRSRRGRVLLGAGLLFAAIFVARLLTDSTSSGLTILYVLPVVLVAVELGRRAGLLAGVVAFALFSAWAPAAPVDVTLVGFLSRGLVFLLVGAVAGHLADRLHAAVASAEASVRHFELARDLLCTASFDGSFVHLNGSWEACLGWSAEELMARPFIEFVHPEDRARTRAETARLAQGDGTISFTNRYATKDGGWRWIEWASSADPERGVIHAAARDVTERRAAEEQLRYLADHDPLSGVLNRRRFAQELERELDRRGAQPRRSVVLLLDLDDFKAINDTLGHAVGDAVIARLGDVLRSRVRSGDVVARLGGDEFAVLLRRTEPETALEAARDLQAVVPERLAEVVGAAAEPVTLSIGLASTAEAGLTVDELLNRADHALYAAKRAGKARAVASDSYRPGGSPTPAAG